MGQINPYWYTSVGTVATTRKKNRPLRTLLGTVTTKNKQSKKKNQEKTPTKQNANHKEKTTVLQGLIK